MSIFKCIFSKKKKDDFENCFLKVANEAIHWRNGELFIFDDSLLHSVENNTNQKRLCLIFDIWREFFF